MSARRFRPGALGWLPVLLVVVALPANAAAARSLRTGLSGMSGASDAGEIADANARIVRIGLSWAGTAPRRPAHPRDPADPAYSWAHTDALVQAASNRGLEVVVTIARAPKWAEGKGKRRATYAGTWKPNARAFGDFAHALAARYSGKNRPRVRYFDVWNEPNLSQYLEPQWKRKHGKRRAESTKLFTRMTNHFYAGVKSVHKSNRVIAPSTSPYGDPRNGPYPYSPRMRPVYFLRHVMCLKRKHGNLRPNKKHCKSAKFDIASHHPLDRTRSHGPTYHAQNPDDAGPGDLGRIRRTVRAAERYGTARPRHKHRALWVTEYWRASKPPDPGGIRLQKQARWIEKGLYVFWRAGASAAIYQELADRGGNPSSVIQSGLLFHDHTKKPAYHAFRFPFVTVRRSHNKVLAWGKTPTSGKLRIQRQRHGGWKTIKRLGVRDDQVFKKTVKVRGKAKLRAKVGSQKSLIWKQKG